MFLTFGTVSVEAIETFVFQMTAFYRLVHNRMGGFTRMRIKQGFL